MKQSVFHKPITTIIMDEIKCKEFHGINGYMPKSNETHYDGKTCDCGKIVFYLERCGCPANVVPTYELKSKPNE